MTGRVDGATRVAAIIGDPVAHSRSPAIYNAAFEATGLNWVFTAFRVAPGDAPTAVRGAGALGLAGLTVTMPHKTDVAAACDDLSPTARRLGAVNVVVFRDGRAFGDSTDGPGFVAALTEHGIDPAGTRILVLGAGGAGRAVIEALGACGASVVVAARRLAAAEESASLAPGAQARSWDDRGDMVREVDVVVNATPIGMQDGAMPFDVDALHSGQLVFDTIYHPAETPLLAAARARGVDVVNGLGMLVHQAARVFELFTGTDAPLAAMWAAARGEAP